MIFLWKYTYRDDGVSFDEASFNINFNFTLLAGEPAGEE
jgi:hypothetical protein